MKGTKLESRQFLCFNSGAAEFSFFLGMMLCKWAIASWLFWDVVAIHQLHHPFIIMHLLSFIILSGPFNPWRWDHYVVSKCQELISQWCSIISHKDRNFTKVQTVKKSTDVWACQWWVLMWIYSLYFYICF